MTEPLVHVAMPAAAAPDIPAAADQVASVAAQVLACAEQTTVVSAVEAAMQPFLRLRV